jgi:hypothetical protein
MRSILPGAISVLAIALFPVSARADEDVCAGGDQESSTDAVELFATADQEVSATTDAAGQCAFVKSRIVTGFFVDGCTSPFRLCTAGRICSGLLAGSTKFTLLTLDAGASAELLVYSGGLVITASGDDLNIHDRGVLNTADATFFEIDPIVGGTGKFTNATGALFAYGTSTTTGFDGTIAGWICRLPADESEEY